MGVILKSLAQFLNLGRRRLLFLLKLNICSIEYRELLDNFVRGLLNFLQVGSSSDDGSVLAHELVNVPSYP